MPCEIKELVVRAVVTEDPNKAAGSEQTASGEKDKSPPLTLQTALPSSVGTLSCEQQQKIVEACVRQVLKILNRSNDR